MDKDGYIALTEKGHEIAETIYERHTLLSSFLMYLGGFQGNCHSGRLPD